MSLYSFWDPKRLHVFCIDVICFLISVEIYFLPTYSRVTWTREGLLFAVFTSFYFSNISKRKPFPSIFILALRLHFTFGS